MLISSDSGVAWSCEFPMVCHWRKYTVEARVLYTDFTLCKFGHYINFGGRCGGEVLERREKPKQWWKRKFAHVRLLQPFRVVRWKYIFSRVRRRQLASFSSVDLYCIEHLTSPLERYIRAFELHSWHTCCKCSNKSSVRVHLQARSHSRKKRLLASSFPSVCMYQRGSCWTDFREIQY